MHHYLHSQVPWHTVIWEKGILVKKVEIDVKRWWVMNVIVGLFLDNFWYLALPGATSSVPCSDCEITPVMILMCPLRLFLASLCSIHLKHTCSLFKLVLLAKVAISLTRLCPVSGYRLDEWVSMRLSSSLIPLQEDCRQRIKEEWGWILTRLYSPLTPTLSWWRLKDDF